MKRRCLCKYFSPFFLSPTQPNPNNTHTPRYIPFPPSLSSLLFPLHPHCMCLLLFLFSSPSTFLYSFPSLSPFLSPLTSSLLLHQFRSVHAQPPPPSI
ncbi:hypothetical protein VNO80_21908 [Phaseolus coccineus]|uniref:Uncharacterized protein n=1 Tax=Phaseolus coccineus TaxID=3886 RepID=A0AAN9M8Z1_PHACN